MKQFNLKTIYNHFAKSKEATWIMKPQNAEALYNFIKKNPIKRVLELGTGIGLSTAVIALAMEDKGETDYKIDSLEQTNKCIKIAKELIPQELQKNLTIHKVNVKASQVTGVPYQHFSVYDMIPEGNYDLIVNDGPSPFEENGAFIDLPNATVALMLLQNKIKPGTYVSFDGRVSSVGLLERYYSDNFFIIQPSKNHDLHILERKDNPINFSDTKHENMKLMNYFEHEENLPANNSEASPSSPASPNSGA